MIRYCQSLGGIAKWAIRSIIEAQLLTEITQSIYPDLRDKVVLITGSGIGEALVTAFLEQASRVVFLDIDQDTSQGLVDRLKARDLSPMFILCDVTDI